jgi:predicted RecA/RadA family phage recombinase
MATNFKAKGDVITVVAPAGGYSSGDGVLVGGLFGVAMGDAALGEDCEVRLSGVFTLPKDNTLAIDQGDRVFWDDGNSEVDKTATAQVAIGHAVEDAADVATTIDIRLAGSTPAGT